MGMSQHFIKDQCLEEGCQNPGGRSLLCPVHAPDYAEPKRGVFTDDVDPIGREEILP
jgi:hypothetical protein